MFGSLVLVFPTPHTGGSLVFRHDGKEWTFDSAQALMDQTPPSVAYAAFFSDVEHEVTTVTSGQRVTLTFNLYYSDAGRKDNPIPQSVLSDFDFRTRVQELLDDAAFLPNGGILGFALCHKYQFKDSLDHVPKLLKGRDMTLWHVFSDLGFQPRVSLVYRSPGDETEVLTEKHFPDGAYVEGSEDFVSYTGGSLTRSIYSDDKVEEEITWVTYPEESPTKDRSPYVAYGNEAQLAYAYGYMVLVVRIGKVGTRGPENRYS